MKKAIIVNIVLAGILTLTGCSSDVNIKEVKNDLSSVNQKIKEIEGRSIKTKSQEDEVKEERDLPKNHVDALRIILKEDGKYVQEMYEYYIENPQDPDIIYNGLNEYFIEEQDYSSSDSWDIPREKGFNVGMLEHLYYFVGMETGNVYAIPNQGTMKAYQIKDNKVQRVCEWLGDDRTDHDWR